MTIKDVIMKNIKYRQAGINALEFMPNLWFEQVAAERRNPRST